MHGVISRADQYEVAKTRAGLSLHGLNARDTLNKIIDRLRGTCPVEDPATLAQIPPRVVESR